MEVEEANSSWKRLFDGVTLIHEPIEEDQNEIKVIRNAPKKLIQALKVELSKHKLAMS